MSTATIPCSKCRRPAVIFQRYSGQHLCRDHFLQDFTVRVKKSIRHHQMIEAGDTIAVAYSGGKDSGALLHFLSTTFQDRRDLSFMAITIDEGIAGYRDLAGPRAFAEHLGVAWHTASFQEAYGLTMDEVVSRKGESRSCSFCGVLRRQLLNKTARDLGCTKLALGFNLDDEAQSVLMNVLRGDAAALTRTETNKEGFLPRIRPFSALPEREVALYSWYTVGSFADDPGCPYARSALRGDVRSLLNEYDFGHPATKYALMGLKEKLAGTMPPSGSATRPCPECGEPMHETCRTCALLREVRSP